jgi:hypothetical protein
MHVFRQTQIAALGSEKQAASAGRAQHQRQKPAARLESAAAGTTYDVARGRPRTVADRRSGAAERSSPNAARQTQLAGAARRAQLTERSSPNAARRAQLAERARRAQLAEHTCPHWGKPVSDALCAAFLSSKAHCEHRELAMPHAAYNSREKKRHAAHPFASPAWTLCRHRVEPLTRCSAGYADKTWVTKPSTHCSLNKNE